MSLSGTSWATMPQTTLRNMPTPAVATGSGYPVSYAYGHSLANSYSSLYEDEHTTVSVPAFNSNPAPYQLPMSTPAIRNLSPQLLLGQSSETMVTVPAPLPADRVISNAPCRGEPSPRFSSLAQDLMPVSLSREARSALPTYIDIYWERVHPFYPIIHRCTGENSNDVALEHVDVLRCAMAAVATQFLGHREHRINGSQLHAYAWQKSKSLTEAATWTLPTMQTILLCEYYARFRGRNKDDYQPSSRFLALYHMISSYCSASLPEISGPRPQRWASWIYIESCRRLFSACFLLSVHGMCYHEQPYSAVLGLENMAASKFPVPLTASTTGLWEARNADAWAAIDVTRVAVTTVGEVMQDAEWSSLDNPAFDISLVIAAHALQLPMRQNRQEVQLVADVSTFRSNDLPMYKHFSRRPGAAAYLALHHTPLHVLLAVSGDSWVFNKKIPDACLFAEYKRRLGEWRNSGTSAIATVFAARAIRDFLSLSHGDGSGPTAASNASPAHGTVTCKEISDYWGLYVCALICWAFGHTGKRLTTEKRLAARNRAIGWVQTVAELEPGQLQALPGREDSQVIVGFVRDALEKDCLGGRNILYADSVGVLRKLEEVDNWSWF